MADIRTTTSELKIVAYFVDGDTRNITLKDPKSNVTSTEIENLQTWMQTNQPVLGDKMGAAFGKIQKATTTTKVEISLDIDN